MAESLVSILEKLEARQNELLADLESLKIRNKELEEENAELRRRESDALKIRDKALLDIQYLQVSHKLAEDPDALIDTRRRIAGLIRNIDRCISMLKE